MAVTPSSQISIVFMGTPEFAVPSLESLHAEKRVKISLVVTQPDKPSGRGLKVTPSPVKLAAQRLGLECDEPAKLNEQACQKILACNADCIAVAAYGRWIPPELFSVPRLRSVNLHPSLLPKYRGASPIQAALLNGDTETAVTTMWITKELDAGDILLQKKVSIASEDNAETLHDKLAREGAALVVETLLGLAAGQIVPIPQDPAKATFTRKISKEMGEIRWDSPAIAIKNQVRAYTPWPGAYTHFDGGVLKIIQAADADRVPENAVPGTILVSDNRRLIIACREGSLEILSLQPQDRRVMSTAEFQAGNRLPEGKRLGRME